MCLLEIKKSDHLIGFFNLLRVFMFSMRFSHYLRVECA